MNRFAGRVALVTGGASGIGAATARRLAAEGASVVVVDLAQQAGQGVVDGINQEGGEAAFVGVDVSDPAGWAVIATQVHAYGRLSVLHSNAYIHRSGAPDTLALSSWNEVLAVNLGGLFLGVQAFAEDLIAEHGSVVATSSVHALVGMPDHSAYAASKGGITALCRQLAVQYGPEVRVNCVLPGPVQSGAWNGVAPAQVAQSARATVLGRLGRPEEVAAAVAFLASEEAAFITGATLVVDGGWSIVKDSR